MAFLYSEAKISPKWKVNAEDLKKWGINFLKFVAPTLVVFFQLLANGVGLDKAWPVAVIAFWQSLADILGKLQDGKK